MPPPVIVAMMIARGTVRFGSLASSDSVETASQPRKDRHRIAAPAMTLANPGAGPAPGQGAARSTVRVPDADESRSAAKARVKIACAAMIAMFARATDTMPMMLRTVTRAIAATTNTHAGIIGKAAER